jgi:hypothetical protein
MEVTLPHEPLKLQQIPMQMDYMIRERNCEQDGEIPPAIKKEETNSCLFVLY